MILGEELILSLIYMTLCGHFMDLFLGFLTSITQDRSPHQLLLSTNQSLL